MTAFLAADPNLYLTLQTGWHWLFTPVKGTVTVYGWGQPSGNPLIFKLTTYDFLDLRVLALELIILGILLLLIPIWLSRHQRSRSWAVVSAAIGLLFGLLISAESLLSPGSLGIKVPLVVATLSTVGFIFSLRLILGGIRPHSRV